MTDKHVSEIEASNLDGSGLQEQIAHWAELLDRWVQSIDTRLGRHDSGIPAPHLEEADVGQSAEH